MPFRPQLFVKKRGTRSTGARWQGLAAEAAFDAALFCIGAFGLYWLIARVLLAEGADYGWWVWPSVVIPISFILFGGAGLAMLAWQAATSTERRAAVAQRASEWELTSRPIRAAGAMLPAVPSIDSVVDSPGTSLANRLPIDAASGWVSATMAVVCLAWNSLVTVFVAQVIRSHVEGQPNWLLTWLMLPLVLAGVWTMVALARQILLTIFIGTTRIEVSHHPFLPGGQYEAIVSQTGRLHARWLQVQLICEEQAIYQQGTDTRRAVIRVFPANVVQPAEIRHREGANVRRSIVNYRARYGDAFVCFNAQRSSLGAGSSAVVWPAGVKLSGGFPYMYTR